MKNPFKYGSRVSGGAFFDRERIMRDMLGVIDGGNNIVIKNLPVSAADVDEAFQSLYATETILLENVFAAHPKSQRLLMRALAKEPTSRFDEGYRDRHALPSTSTINTALKRLMKESVVESQDGVHSLADPLLAYHLSRR